MPRYEFKDDKSSKFWDIQIEGTEVTANWGRIGTNGQTKTKSFDSAAAAQKDYDKQIAGKTKKGYVLAGGGEAATSSAPTKAASNPELEAAIRQAPDDQAGYQVYGDWLQAEGDPIGELVSIQCAMSERPDAAELRAEETKIFKAHTAHFYGPAHEDADDATLKFAKWEGWRKPKGWPDEIWTYGFAHAVWRYGFIHRLHYDTGYYDDEDERGSDVAAAWLVKLLAAPAARFVREVTLGELWADYGSGEGPEMEYAVKALIGAPCATTLRSIVFNGGEHDVNGVSLDASGLADACPNLEQLVLHGGQLTVGDLNFAKMKRFAAQTGGLDSADMEKICAAKMPLIEDLEVWFGDEEYGASCTIEHVAPLLTKSMPKLKRLGLMNSQFGDDICKAVVGSPLLAQLGELDLSMGVITDDGAGALISNKDKLAHLSKLSIRGYFSDDVAAALQTLASDRTIEVEGDMSEDYRYVEVSE